MPFSINIIYKKDLEASKINPLIQYQYYNRFISLHTSFSTINTLKFSLILVLHIYKQFVQFYQK